MALVFGQREKNMKKLKSLSIFFPFWNEEENVENVVSAAVPVAERIAEKWEMIIVDDGSSDNTLKIAKKLANKFENVRVAHHFPNRGYGAALKEGFANCNFEIIVFTDGDGQFDFSEIGKFISKIDSNDIVIGFREKRRDNTVRHVLMNMLKVWDFVFFGFHFKDIDCGFKMFRKSAIDKMMPFKSEGAMITTEILAKAKKNNLKIAQVPVTHYKRLYGKESGADLFVITRAILESIRLWGGMISGRF